MEIGLLNMLYRSLDTANLLVVMFCIEGTWTAFKFNPETLDRMQIIPSLFFTYVAGGGCGACKPS